MEQIFNKYVIKRNGTRQKFDKDKIIIAIQKASHSANDELDQLEIENIANSVVTELKEEKHKLSVELIQDIVEMKLMEKNYYNTTKNYILYRDKQNRKRNAGKHLLDSYNDLLFVDSEGLDLKRDNANVDGNSPMGTMLKLGTEASKTYTMHYALPEKLVKPFKDLYVYYHDFDFSLITFNCLTTDLKKQFKNGFNTGHGYLREPNSIRSYAALSCISIQSSQNDMYGGQGITAYDFAMSDGVRKSFKKALKQKINDFLQLIGIKTTKDIIEEIFNNKELDNVTYSDYKNEKDKADKCVHIFKKVVNEVLYKHLLKTDIKIEQLYYLACDDVEEETKQAMEAVVHNFNTLQSRAGQMWA